MATDGGNAGRMPHSMPDRQGASSAATKRRKPTKAELERACVDLLARQLFLTAEVGRSADKVTLVQATEEWDNDRLLPEAYERFKTLALEALDAH